VSNPTPTTSGPQPTPAVTDRIKSHLTGRNRLLQRLGPPRIARRLQYRFLSTRIGSRQTKFGQHDIPRRCSRSTWRSRRFPNRLLCGRSRSAGDGSSRRSSRKSAVIRPIGACVNRPAGVASLLPPSQMKPPLFFTLDAAERAVGKRLFRQLERFPAEVNLFVQIGIP